MVKIGDRIHIVKMYDMCGIDLAAKKYSGKEGVVTQIDDAGQIHGTWGGLALIPDVDEFIVV